MALRQSTQLIHTTRQGALLPAHSLISSSLQLALRNKLI